MNIGELLTEDYQKEYLERLEVFYPATLFPPNFDALKIGRCPLCSCLLKQPKNGKVLFCKSKKHAKPFIIKAEKMKELTRT